MTRWPLLALRYVWAAPWTCFGLGLGLLALATGGRGQRHGPILEFWGGWPRWLLERAPLIGGAIAITFGHVVLGRSLADVERCRQHEMVHVQQYERWGPFFIPAYLLCSLLLWLFGRSAYLDNPFEVEAYYKAGQI